VGGIDIGVIYSCTHFFMDYCARKKIRDLLTLNPVHGFEEAGWHLPYRVWLRKERFIVCELTAAS